MLCRWVRTPHVNAMRSIGITSRINRSFMADNNLKQANKGKGHRLEGS
jgi:hypothetical protein